MAYEDATNYNTVRSMKGYPIGAIVPWSGEIDAIPVGWVSCSGGSPPITRYPLLYDVIGNTYGGTPGTTFRLPNLNDGSSAIMDIYRGHFSYLQSAGDAHKPENTNISLDSFWNNVGNSASGDKPGNSQTNWLSTIDVVGEQISRPTNLVAKHNTFVLSEGDVSFTYSVVERKLSDRHVPNHNHPYQASDGAETSYSRRGNLASQCQGYFGEDATCALSGTCTTISRSRNDPPKNGTEMETVGAGNVTTTTYRAGGGRIENDGLLDPSIQERATGMSNGDGFTGGDMWAHRNGTRYYFTNLSHEDKTFAEITGHSHGSLEYNWISKIKIINPGIVSDVQLNTVTIDNSAGVNFGSINMNSATPTLTMIYIIKAF